MSTDMTDGQERTARRRKPSQCPACGARPVATILYGLPRFTEELEAQLRAGTVTLGGCLVGDDDPSWRCTRCGLEIYRSQQ